jgi:hypothetical protein
MRLACGLILTVTVATAQLAPNPLVGRWRSSEVSSAGISALFEFRPDNQVDSYSSVILEQKYRLLGTDTIVLQSKEGREEKQELEWDSQDHARIEDEAAGTKIELVRHGKVPDPKNPLVGEWATAREWHANKYPARALFFSDGRVLWMIDIRIDHGRYSVQNQNLRLEIPEHPVLEGAYSLEGNRLSLPNPRGGTTRFERL